jgi:transketolase
MISKLDLKQFSRFGPRAMFGQFMMEIAKNNKNLMVLSADLGRSSGLDRFKKEFPSNYLSVGICEQNLIGVASGLSKEGYKVFVTSFAPFLSMRASEQIRMNLGYMKHNVNLVALGSGLGMGFLGNSHYGLEDIAVMRSIPNMNIICPADNLELKKILIDCSSINRGPNYIRLTGVPGSPSVYEKDFKYKYGSSQTIANGKDVLVIGIGSIVAEAKKACESLKNKNIGVKLINAVQVKPLDKKIHKLIKDYDYVVTVEEHTSVGGLGSVISELISINFQKKKLATISLPDKFGPTGDYNYLLDYHKLTSSHITKRIEKFLKK